MAEEEEASGEKADRMPFKLKNRGFNMRGIDVASYVLPVPARWSCARRARTI